jgi:hypothetical protein
MNLVVLGIFAVVVMIAATLGLLEVGRRFGVMRSARDPEGVKSVAGAAEGAVFGLMGLLIAFTFSGAATRFDTRRAQLVEEANCIGTAWLRLDLLPADTQLPLREKLREYTDARIAAFRKLHDTAKTQLELDRATRLQNEIWKQALAACQKAQSPSATMLVVPALNQMFDIATTRTTGTRMHPPLMIYSTLALLVLAGALVTGYDMGASKTRNWFHSLTFVLVVSLAIYVILDFEFPRIGLIRIHSFDIVLVELRQSMNP